MNLQHLRHFVAIAEERHFGRAAMRLNMAQPPLSQSLARLEASLGFRLVERTRRSVALTPAGEALLADLRPALARIDRAVRNARQAQAGSPAHLDVGFVSAAVIDIVPRLLALIGERFPQTEVQLYELSTNEQLDQLHDGRLDIGFVHATVRQDADVRMRRVTSTRQLLAIPAGWPIAQRAVVEIADLEGVPFITPPPAVRTDGQALLEIECRRRGFTLHASQQITRNTTALGLIAAEVGVALSNSTVAKRGYPGVTFRPIAGLPDNLGNELSIAWLDGGPSSADMIAEEMAVD